MQIIKINTPTDFKEFIGVPFFSIENLCRIDPDVYEFVAQLHPDKLSKTGWRDLEKRIRSDIDSIMADYELIDSQEPSLVRDYLNGIEEPLYSLADIDIGLYVLHYPIKHSQIGESQATMFLFCPEHMYFMVESNSAVIHQLTRKGTCTGGKNLLKMTLIDRKVSDLQIWSNRVAVDKYSEGNSQYCLECSL